MQTSNIPGPIAATRTPTIKLPPSSTDCHAHIFGPVPKYQVLPRTHFVPPDCLLPDYLKMLRTIGCERAVLVQPSVYGPDNAAIIEALQEVRRTRALERSAIEMRAVAVVAPDVSDRELTRLHDAGFRGIRINTASGTPGLKLEHAPALAARIKPMGWHLQFYANFREMPQVEAALAALGIDIVIDHFGRVLTAEGLQAPAFQALLRLLRRDNCWAKLMGPYFISDAAGFADVAPFAQAMVAAAPNRVVWGTDWPHPSAKEKMPNDGDLADLLLQWVPDELQRRRLLVDNPARLYGFN